MQGSPYLFHTTGFTEAQSPCFYILNTKRLVVLFYFLNAYLKKEEKEVGSALLDLGCFILALFKSYVDVYAVMYSVSCRNALFPCGK